jgi:dihydrofolate synthase/folylpolyglutamate synthase
VSLEHTESLGKTVLEIAKEKAGIIKADGTLITATEDDSVFTLFERICKEHHSKIYRVGKDITFRRLSSSLDGQSFQLSGLMNHFDELHVPLLGYHQLLNAACAVGVVEALSFCGVAVSTDAIDEGLRKVKWPGRLEIVQRDPLVVLDCAKDPEAARALKETMLNDFVYDRLIAVVSVSSSKNIPEMIAQFSQIADQFIITSHKVMGRAASPFEIAKEIKKYSKPYEIVIDAKRAVSSALRIAGRNDIVCVAGSVFLVGEAKEFWGCQGNRNECPRKR